MMTDDEIISVVQAHKEGKKIQFQTRIGTIWRDCEVSFKEPSWNFNLYRYRVAPEPRKPREWRVVVTGGDEICSYSPLFYGEPPSYTIKVREVIEPSRDQRTWFAEFPLDGSVGQIFTDPRQLTKGGKLVRVMEILE